MAERPLQAYLPSEHQVLRTEAAEDQAVPLGDHPEAEEAERTTHQADVAEVAAEAH